MNGLGEAVVLFFFSLIPSQFYFPSCERALLSNELLLCHFDEDPILHDDAPEARRRAGGSGCRKGSGVCACGAGAIPSQMQSPWCVGACQRQLPQLGRVGVSRLSRLAIASRGSCTQSQPRRIRSCHAARRGASAPARVVVVCRRSARISELRSSLLERCVCAPPR